MDQLVKHQKTFLACPDWLGSVDDSRQPALRLTNIALQISSALEDADTISARLSQPGTRLDAEAAVLFHHMTDLEARLRQWLTDFYSWSGAGYVPYKLVGLSQYPSFERRCGDLAFLVRRVFEYPNLLSATCHTYVWICLLALKTAMIATSRLFETSSRNHCDVLTEEASEHASDLVRTLAFLSAAEHRAAGVLACSGPLHWAERWYVQQGETEKVGLCRSIRDSLERESATPLNLHNPVFTWWMLPNIFVQQR